MTRKRRATLKAPPAPEPTMAVPVKLMREAHACMRACGWQLAPGNDESEDPTLALAVADIEDRFRKLLGGMT